MEGEKKIGFLFGAGAEGNFNLPNGNDFLLNTLLKHEDKDIDKLLNVLFKYFNVGYFSKHECGISSEEKDKIIKHERQQIADENYKKELLKRLIKNHSHDKDFFEKNLEPIRSILSKSDFISIVKKLSSSTDKEKERDSVLKENINGIWMELFEKIALKQPYYKSKIEESIIQLLENFIDFGETDDSNNEKGCVPSFKKSVPISFKLDAMFHSIIDPHDFSVVYFFRIFNYYWRCYFYIVEHLINYLHKNKIIDNEDLLDFIEDGSDDKITLRYDIILNNMPRFTNFLYDAITKINEEESYYYWISKQFKEIEVKGIITTNYSNLCR